MSINTRNIRCAITAQAISCFKDSSKNSECVCGSQVVTTPPLSNWVTEQITHQNGTNEKNECGLVRSGKTWTKKLIIDQRCSFTHYSSAPPLLKASLSGPLNTYNTPFIPLHVRPLPPSIPHQYMHERNSFRSTCQK